MVLKKFTAVLAFCTMALSLSAGQVTVNRLNYTIGEGRTGNHQVLHRSLHLLDDVRVSSKARTLSELGYPHGWDSRSWSDRLRD
jgi:hypothetical protein